ncbi:MAG TPA: tyrosine-type recombinase/integrase [Mesorhizobium sp.]|jgi:integrase|uniref:tyrosine-type recombinase/integrase n=1 Tax=Mesorhizobium sp. TaxID=1871066 RepID=UPI002DDCB073|nr:tyrosine-type recombinase/integrase [Mesorhizobium sp.]HEV2502370.1 tyrosine-type recombinase/integrase [Mesorhizobium sp.]
MGRKADPKDRDRYLQDREGNWSYKRRVPAKVGDLDERGPVIRISLDTDDIAIARTKRDVYEEADNALWASLIQEGETSQAKARYTATVKRAEALGYAYRAAPELASTAKLEDVLERIEGHISGQTPLPVARAVLGGETMPPVKVSEAFKTYKVDIAADENVQKSIGQKKKWANVKQRAVDRFIALNGDMNMLDIGREHATKMYDFWRPQIAPEKGQPTRTASSGNRELGNMRVLYRDYFNHAGLKDRPNPFDGLGFREKNRKKRSRPPFPIEWIRDVLLQPGPLAKLNDEARGVVLAMVETGARPSELCNLTASRIVLKHKVPHLVIETRDDPEDPREVKAESSERIIPLVGVALDVFRKHPEGFPRYRDKESAMSAAINKFMKENNLRPSPRHVLYSLRHSFEDRMKNAKLDSELRRALMGHTIDRPNYGEGGSLEWRRNQLRRIVLKYDPAIV